MKVRQIHRRKSQTKKWNGSQKSMRQAVTQSAIEAAKAAIMSVREAENLVGAARSVWVATRTGDSALKQQTHDLKAADKYREL